MDYGDQNALSALLVTGEVIVFAGSNCLCEPVWLTSILDVEAFRGPQEAIHLAADRFVVSARAPEAVVRELVFRLGVPCFRPRLPQARDCIPVICSERLLGSD